ncbi:hypothetical protein GCM10025778_20600 [Paeniglutamicibacter antarcticus]|uniref:Aminoglycoside phosphotransferase domain-containing protein n=1 Tax=Paeniglutamicibacter antarcticus TaxID=494023 RepID=A0ABP9TP44_9MICC
MEDVADWIKTWTEDNWRAEVLAWIDMACEAYSIERIGPLQNGSSSIRAVHRRVPTASGLLYFKAVAPGQLFEPPVSAVAAALVPERLVMPLAINPERGWMLSPDYGATLDELATTPLMWARALGALGELQREVVDCEEALFDAGLQILDPARIPDEFNNALTLHASLPAGHPLGITTRDADHAFAAFKDIEEACAQLSAGAIPLSLEHGSFDRRRVFAPTDESNAPRILNLGDAHWAHPFASLARPVERMQIDFRTSADDPRIIQAIGAYLGAWSDYGSPDELYELVAPAIRISPLHTHETWLQLLAEADEPTMLRWAPMVLEPLASLASATA